MSSRKYWCVIDENDVYLPKLFTEKEHAENYKSDLDKSWGGFKVEEMELVGVKK